MSRSLAKSANFIFKLHTAALQAPRKNVKMYPVMDGLYVSSPSQDDILVFLNSIFKSVAEEFIREDAMQHRFVIKGALAYGPIIHGCAIPQPASAEMHNSPEYRDALLLGLPMVQAHSNEKMAPPFGIYVHESARTFAPNGDGPLHFIWWKWRSQDDERWSTLATNLQQYFDWCEERAGEIEYEVSRIKVHRTMASQYFVRQTRETADGTK